MLLCIQCVATCGSAAGFQVRAVACSAAGICPENTKPVARRSCLVEDLLAACTDGKMHIFKSKTIYYQESYGLRDYCDNSPI